MSGLEIGEATAEERLWCARLMASSEPWITLGRGADACRAATVDPDYVVLVAREGGAPLGFARLHPHGVAGSPYLASIAVDPSARSRGVGTALLEAREALQDATTPRTAAVRSSEAHVTVTYDGGRRPRLEASTRR
jgi:ribosomal-protein-alanine N-acetyltransferase